MIQYTTDINLVNEDSLTGFFVGWPNPPSPSNHMKILKGSYLAWMAIDTETGKIAGFINAISDGVLSAYIPLIEVLPEYQNKGIGKELVIRMLKSLSKIYMIDLLCDEGLQDYYAKFGMAKTTGSMIRNYSRQNCE